VQPNLQQHADEVAVQELFGARVREVRQTRGLTQESLAHLAGLDRSYVGQVERGERNIALINIVKLALAMSITPAELLSVFDEYGREG
jgi:transcriptional regulator with XRE-family HTH domain